MAILILDSGSEAGMTFGWLFLLAGRPDCSLSYEVVTFCLEARDLRLEVSTWGIVAGRGKDCGCFLTRLTGFMRIFLPLNYRQGLIFDKD